MDIQPIQPGGPRCASRTLALASACVAVLLVGVGCENDETTKAREVQQKVTAARTAMHDASPESAEIARKNLREASDLSGSASAASRIEAKALFAHSSYSAAVDKMPEVSAAEARAARALRELLQLATVIATNNLQIDHYKGSDPAANGADPVKGFETARADFQTRAGRLDADIQKLQQEKKALEEQAASAEAKRAEAIKQANALSERSDQTQGQESVNLFKQAADARATAGLLANEIDLAKTRLAQIETRVADITRQKEILLAAAKSMETQVAEIKNSWAATQEKIANRQSASKSLVDLASEKEKGIAALAKEFAAARDEAAAARKVCLDDYLDAAIAQYEDATSTAEKYNAELKELARDAKANSVAFKRMQQVYDPLGLKLAKARALFTRGGLYMQEKNLLEAQQNAAAKILDPVFKQAGLTVPPEIASPDLDERVKKSREDAERDLTAARELIVDVVDRAPEPDPKRDPFLLKNDAFGLQAAVEFTLYRLNGKQEHLAAAQSAVEALDKGEGLTFPALPDSIKRTARSSAAVTPPSGGRTGPATNRVTSPDSSAEGETPATGGRVRRGAAEQPAPTGETKPEEPKPEEPKPEEPKPEEPKPDASTPANPSAN